MHPSTYPLWDHKCVCKVWVCFCPASKFICVLFWIPRTSDIIWCLSFTVWLILLSRSTLRVQTQATPYWEQRTDSSSWRIFFSFTLFLFSVVNPLPTRKLLVMVFPIPPLIIWGRVYHRLGDENTLSVFLLDLAPDGASHISRIGYIRKKKMLSSEPLLCATFIWPFSHAVTFFF